MTDSLGPYPGINFPCFVGKQAAEDMDQYCYLELNQCIEHKKRDQWVKRSKLIQSLHIKRNTCKSSPTNSIQNQTKTKTRVQIWDRSLFFQPQPSQPLKHLSSRAFGVNPEARYFAAVSSTFRHCSLRSASMVAFFSSPCLWIPTILFFISSPYSAFFFSIFSFRFTKDQTLQNSYRKPES